MTEHFDSRALGPADCYGQRFMRAGRYGYALVAAGGAPLAGHFPFAIEVAERGGEAKMNQHLVTVSVSGEGFNADPPALRVEAGDLVLWSARGASCPPFAVAGDKPFFDSSRLVNESGYSHAFGRAGDYAWCDAHGSPIAGEVRVRDVQCRTAQDVERWRERLARGALVMIQDGRADPSAVEVVVGQTVFFSVVKGPGISITDRRLIDRDGGGKRGQSQRE